MTISCKCPSTDFSALDASFVAFITSIRLVACSTSPFDSFSLKRLTYPSRVPFLGARDTSSATAEFAFVYCL